VTRRDAAAVRDGAASVPSRSWWRLPMVAAVAATIGLGAWLVGISVAAGSTVLQVRDQVTNEVVHVRAIEVGETFQMVHIHSVTRRPVIETFSVKDPTTLAIEELWFDEPGPGLPAGSEQIGDRTTTFLAEDGAFRVLHHGHPIGSVPMIVGSASVDHVLKFEDGTQLRLRDVARSGSAVELLVGGQP